MSLTPGAIPFLKGQAAKGDNAVSKSDLVYDGDTSVVRGGRVEPQSTFDSGMFDSGVQWELDDNGVLTLSGNGEIPSNAFDDNTKAKIITVKCAPNSQITRIKSGAFS